MENIISNIIENTKLQIQSNNRYRNEPFYIENKEDLNYTVTIEENYFELKIDSLMNKYFNYVYNESNNMDLNRNENIAIKLTARDIVDNIYLKHLIIKEVSLKNNIFYLKGYYIDGNKIIIEYNKEEIIK